MDHFHDARFGACSNSHNFYKQKWLSKKGYWKEHKGK